MLLLHMLHDHNLLDQDVQLELNIYYIIILKFSFIEAVNNPIPIKQLTATIDLGANLGNPHTPCPLVHPFPIFVPNPTQNPAIIDPPHPIYVRTYKLSYAGVPPSIIDLVVLYIL